MVACERNESELCMRVRALQSRASPALPAVVAEAVERSCQPGRGRAALVMGLALLAATRSAEASECKEIMLALEKLFEDPDREILSVLQDLDLARPGTFLSELEQCS